MIEYYCTVNESPMKRRLAMSKYATNYEYWQNEKKEMLPWVLDNKGKIAIGDVVEALNRHPGCYLAIVEPEFNLFIERIGEIP